MRRALAAWLPLLLAACATVPPPSDVGMPDAGWRFSGRIGIQTETQSLSGGLRWQHRPDADSLFLSTPLGQGVARIERSAAGVTLELPDQPPRQAPDAETLTRDALGYALPVAGLAWWMQARPDPARPFAAEYDDAGRLARLKQDGWTIDYRQYVQDRPRRLTLTREGLEIRLVADEWRGE